MDNNYPALLNQIDITMFEQNIEQIPTKSNDHTAICTTSIATKDKCFSTFGVATPDMIDGSTNTQQLLEIAALTATQKASCMLNQSKQAQPVTVDINAIPQSVNPIHMQSQQQAIPNKQYNHNPNKPMSGKQLEALEGIAKKKGLSLSSAALQTTGKTIDNLSSYDANNLFDYYKKM